MSKYLQHLIESTYKDRAFISKEAEIELTEDEIREELQDMLTEDDVLDGLLLSELDVGQGFGQIVMRLTKGEATVGAGVAAAAIAWLAVKAIGKATANPECKKYDGLTMRKCNQIVNSKKKMTALKSKMSLCSGSKDPGACKTKVQGKINAMAEKIKNLGKIEGVG